MDYFGQELDPTNEYEDSYTVDDILAEYAYYGDGENNPGLWEQSGEVPVQEPEPRPGRYYAPAADDVRAYVASYEDSPDYLDLREEEPEVPEEQFDARFLMGRDAAAPAAVTYGEEEVDISADEDYVPPEQPESPSQWTEDETGEAEPRRLSRREKRLRKIARAEEEYTDSYEEEGDYARDMDYTPEEEGIPEEDFFPESFGEYLSSVVTSMLYRFRGAGGGASSSFTETEEEDLGPEVSPAEASKYYGSFTRSLRLRFRLSLFVLLILLWIGLGLPVGGMLKNIKVAAAACLCCQLLISLLGLDVFTNGILNAFRLRPGADTLAVFSCIVTGLDALLIIGDMVSPHMPLCMLSSLSLVGVLFSSLLNCRALRKSMRVPAIAKSHYTVSGESGVQPGEITLLKSVRPYTGFIRRSEEAAPDEELFGKLSLPILIFALLLSLALAVAKKSFSELIYIFSAVFAPAVPFTALLCYALPFFLGSNGIFSSGAAIAGWSGLLDIGQSANLIVTDRDIFPDGSIELENVRVFAEEDPDKIIAYAGSMVRASDSCLAECFRRFMDDKGCPLKRIEEFEYLSGGGMKGIIDGDVVICGNSDLMRLMNIRVPFRLVNDSSVLLSINGILYGIFHMNYTALPQVRNALVELMRSSRHPIFAIRDFNVTPRMLRDHFDIATDGYDFPPYVERFTISAAEPAPDSRVSAVVCREGLGPLARMADVGRRMYVSVRANLIITVIGAILGMLVTFVKLASAGTVGAGFLLLYMLCWALPVFVISVFMQ